MFYEVALARPEPDEKQVSALVVLNPAESRRLLARATVALPEVRNAYKNGMIIIARGITNAFVTEELLGVKVEPKADQTVGFIGGGITNSNTGPPPCASHVIKKGKMVEGADSSVEILDFGPDDVFIKGGNAIDTEGNAGICVASRKGGTIGMAWPIVIPRDAHLIMPIGLEKLVPSVIEAARHSGIYHFKYSTGLPFRLAPVTMGEVVSEIQAFALLAGVRTYHLGSGGIDGSEGAVTLALEGAETRVKNALELAKSVKGEPPVGRPETVQLTSAADYNYDARAQLNTLGGI
ncbi:MAG: hypothetical protein QF906_03520 [Dehalococcoidales bacterium]|nr:hypothetical protein [Dehalococcoidales bacterium]MDP7415899.1 hypothetical protein [Dehalococcoidales bacterium]